MVINVHAGHNPDGKTACGAVGLIKESTEARAVKDRVVSLLKKQGHTVYDCTVSDGISQGDVLSKIVKKCNAHKADLDLSIHFNAGRNDYAGDGSVGGTEVWIYNSASKAKETAERVCNQIAALGFRNRGVKTSSDLYVLRKTVAPALLVECCFVDDADDVKLYYADTMAAAIAEAVIPYRAESSVPSASGVSEPFFLENVFRVKVTDEALNIRSGPGMQYKITGCIKDHGIYTITETFGNWGKLKSGAGWISISTKYVKYL